jgi:hypothetical protein
VPGADYVAGMPTLRLALGLSLFTASLLIGAAAGSALADEPTPSDAVAEALPHGGLAGSWLLDKEASDDIDPLLVALGRSRLKRTMARKIKTITHEVAVSGTGMTVRIQAGPMDQTSELTFGKPSETFVVGGSSVVTARLEGDVVVAEGPMEIDGKAAIFRSERSLLDPDTTLVVRALQFEGEQPLRVRRIFRRQP